MGNCNILKKHLTLFVEEKGVRLLWMTPFETWWMVAWYGRFWLKPGVVKFQFEIMRCHVATTYYFNYRWRAGFLPVAGAALGDPGVYESWLPSFGDDGGSRNCSADDQRTLSCLCSYSSRPRGRVRVHRAGVTSPATTPSISQRWGACRPMRRTLRWNKDRRWCAEGLGTVQPLTAISPRNAGPLCYRRTAASWRRWCRDQPASLTGKRAVQGNYAPARDAGRDQLGEPHGVGSLKV